ncbi:hypothetical protein ACFL0F_00255 [Patescibacteria group bacterium]
MEDNKDNINKSQDSTPEFQKVEPVKQDINKQTQINNNIQPGSEPTEEQKKVEQPEKKGSNFILPLLILLLLVAIGAASYFGYKYYQYVYKKEPTSTTLTPTIVPVTSADPISNWNVYENSKYGYQIKFPDNWEYNRGPGNVSDEELSDSRSINVYDPEEDNPGTSFMIDTNEFDQVGLSKNCIDLESCVGKAIDTFSSYTNDLLIPEDSKFLNQDAKTLSFIRKTDSYSQTWYHLFAILDDDLYHFSTYSNTDDYKDGKLIFDQILSTFKFLDKEGKNDYVNEQLGFSLVIPDSWDGFYKVVVSENQVTFNYSNGDQTYGLFTIKIVSIQEWEKLNDKTQPFYGKELVTKNNNVYYLAQSIDNPFIDEDGDRYQNMAVDINEIFSSFNLLE